MPRTKAELLEYVTARAERLRQNLTNLTNAEISLGCWLPVEWHMQYPMVLEGARGKLWPVIFDFYCPPAKLAIEVDGGIHDRHKGHDARRDRACRWSGIEVLRFTNARIENDLPAVLAEITKAIEGREQ